MKANPRSQTQPAWLEKLNDRFEHAIVVSVGAILLNCQVRLIMKNVLVVGAIDGRVEHAGCVILGEGDLVAARLNLLADHENSCAGQCCRRNSQEQGFAW